MLDLLDNIIWHSLTGPHARLSCGTSNARRLLPGFTPFAGFADAERPAFAELAPYCEPGEFLFCGGWAGDAAGAWPVEFETVAHQFVWQQAMPEADAGVDVVALHSEHVPQMLELVALTQPGPFAERTIELGDYFGVFDNGQLVAMAGERLAAGSLREISGVCTRPGFQGRGLAHRLMDRLIRLQMQRGQTPFLHVMHDNPAREMYLRMGFRLHREGVIRVVSCVK